MAWGLFAPPAPPAPAAPPPCPLPATSLAAALLALLAALLAVFIIRVRRGSGIPYQADDRVFVKRQRALANLSEYAPLFLIMLALIEADPNPRTARAAPPLAALFVAGRAAHAASMGFDADFAWRVRGTGATLGSLILAAGVLVVRVVAGGVGAWRA